MSKVVGLDGKPVDIKAATPAAENGKSIAYSLEQFEEGVAALCLLAGRAPEIFDDLEIMINGFKYGLPDAIEKIRQHLNYIENTTSARAAARTIIPIIPDQQIHCGRPRKTIFTKLRLLIAFVMGGPK